MNTTIIAAPLTTVIVWAIIAYLNKRFPLDQQKYTFAELKKEFGRRWDIGATVMGVGCFAALTFLIAVFLQHEAAPCGLTTDKATGDITLAISKGMLYLPAGFASLGLAGFAYLAICKLILRGRYKRYMAYINFKAKYNVIKVFPYAGIAGCLLGGILSYPFMSSRIELRKADLSLDGKVRPYEAIKSVYDVAGYKSSSQINADPHIIIKFGDGSYWNSSGSAAFFYAEHKWIIEKAAERSGKEVVHVQTLDEE